MQHGILARLSFRIEKHVQGGEQIFIPITLSVPLSVYSGPRLRVKAANVQHDSFSVRVFRTDTVLLQAGKWHHKEKRKG